MAAIAGPLAADPGRVALIGMGAFGQFCLAAYRLSGDIRVLAVADPNAAALEQARPSGAELFQDWRALMANDAIEVIHVATPPFVRAGVIDAAFAAGKSVFCEKPLALSLPEADGLIRAARAQNRALGVNYVMRHLPAYRLLERLASSGLAGAVRSLSFQNFAQHMPADHWFWDEAQSGGILVEHGVHFFDAYGQIAGPALETWGDAPRLEAVDVGVRYAGGAIGRFYHEFAFPRPVEHAAGITMFERGHMWIEGWIPMRLRGAVIAPENEVAASFGDPGMVISEDGEAVHFSVDFPDRDASYRDGIVAGMRDMVRRHRDPDYAMAVPPEDARRSLALALAARNAIRQGEIVRVAD